MRSRIDWPFLRLASLSFVVVAACAAYPLSTVASPDILRSVAAGGIMSFVNFLLGYAAIEVGFDKPNTVFLKVILGGMAGRLMLMWGAFLILAGLYKFHVPSLVYTLLLLYVLNLALEIYFLQKKVSVKGQP